MHNKTRSTPNLNIPNPHKESSNNNPINALNNKKQSYEKNQTTNRDIQRENLHKETRDSESYYANKDNETLLRKSTDFYFLPKIKLQNNNENSLTNNNINNLKQNILFKNKTISINNSNLNFGYMKNMKNETNSNNYNFVENNNRNNNYNTNNTNTLNTTSSHLNTSSYNPKIRQSNSFKNYNFFDESYYYRFKASTKKNMISANFNNISNNNSKPNAHNETNSISVSQKKIDFESIIENEKIEEKKRLQRFFQKLNMSYINNFPTAKNFNINNNNKNNINPITSYAKSNHNISVNKNSSIIEPNEKDNHTLNNDGTNIQINLNRNYDNNNIKCNSEENTNHEESNKIKYNTTKNSNDNSPLHKKENNKRKTQIGNNSNYNILNPMSNYMTFAPKNNFDAIRHLMTNPTEHILNSVGTIKNRSKIKIVNRKLQISKEIPAHSYMITSIKPPSLFDFNTKLKGKIVLKKETELQKMRNLKSNPAAYYEDEEIEFNNENESEKDKEPKETLFKKQAENSYQKIKSELQQEGNIILKNQSENNFYNTENKDKSQYNNNKENDIHEKEQGHEMTKGIILNYLERKEKKSALSIQNIPQTHIASVDNSFTLHNSENNYNLNHDLNDVLEDASSSDIDSSFKNEKHRRIKAKFQEKFDSEEKLGLTASKQNLNFKNESDYFDEKTNAAPSRKVSTEKINLGYSQQHKQTEKTYSDTESLQESDVSIHEEKIHNLDDSGILQVKRHESLYVKAQHKFCKGNKNLTQVASKLSFKPGSISPEIIRGSETSVVPLIHIKQASPGKAVTSNFNATHNRNNFQNNLDLNFNSNYNVNKTNHNHSSGNKNFSYPSLNLNLNSSIQNQTVRSSLFDIHESIKSPDVSSNMLNVNQSHLTNSVYNQINNNNNTNNVEVPDLTQHDFEPHEVEPNLKTKTEIKKIKDKIINMKKKRFNFKNEFLNDVHKRLQKKAFEINPDYQSTKDIFLKYRQEKVLEKTDFNISSRLYLQNRNPIFQINNMISFPLMIDDPVFLANIYNINMFKIESTVKNKIN